MTWSNKISPNDPQVAECSTLFQETMPSDKYYSNGTEKPEADQIFSEFSLNIRLSRTRVIENTTQKPYPHNGQHIPYEGPMYEMFLYEENNVPEIAIGFDLSIKRNNAPSSNARVVSFHHWHIHVGFKENPGINRATRYQRVTEKCNEFLNDIQQLQPQSPPPMRHKLFVAVGPGTLDTTKPIDQLLSDFVNDYQGQPRIVPTNNYPYYRDYVDRLIMYEIT